MRGLCVHRTRCGCEIEQDDDGWFFVSCLCGWQFGPLPDAEDAADAYGDHRAAKAVTATANVIKKAQS